MIRLMLALALAAPLTALADDAPKDVLALETTWRTEAGGTTTLSKWKGRWYALTFVYTSCAGSCPLTTKKLKRLDAALVKAGKPLELVVVSIDPAHDTPEEVRKYRERYELKDAKRWSVLVGPESEVRTLTMLLDFRYSKNPESGVIMHDNTVYLVGPDGTVRASMSSLGEAMESFVEAVPAPSAPRGNAAKR